MMCLLYYMHECCSSSSSEDKKDLEANRSNKAKRKRRKKPFWLFLSRLLFLELKHLSHNLDMGNLQRSLSPSSLSTSSSSSLGPHPLQIDPELWLMAEKRTQEILYAIQPTFASEHKRMEVIDYIQSLIKYYFPVEVFAFGSVPLKTYLPDGDIDLMVLSHQNMEEELARGVCTLLQREELDPEFQVNDVQYIHAQVNLFNSDTLKVMTLCSSQILR
ncbi:PREDICTED: uncharacterized protein LOC105108696 [Populus euphratica]|uniref:Uncharacterized protein LOC105108696 n=1 Tax=Populus euphratica TaxID=75702 RepID=A0AAJ6SZ84_POPEU|nr:PREDICTED: uncharacterized protein LOC105108696 [Populus euphratica]